MRTRRVLIGLTLVGLVFAVLPGCASKVTQQNYDKINNGMTLDEVQKILGKGTEEASAAGAIGDLTGSGKVMTWTKGEKKITITFANGKVVAKTASGI